MQSFERDRRKDLLRRQHTTVVAAAFIEMRRTGFGEEDGKEDERTG